MQQPNKESTGRSDKIFRRRVLQLASSTAVVGGALSFLGSASAHNAMEVRFCGCSQVCASGEGRAFVLVAEETDNGFDFSVVEQSFPFCYEVSTGKIVALAVPHHEDDHPHSEPDAYRFQCNPIRCAEKALAAFDDDLENRREIDLPSHGAHEWQPGDYDGCDDTAEINTGRCGKPPGHHPGQGGRDRNSGGNGR